MAVAASASYGVEIPASTTEVAQAPPPVRTHTTDHPGHASGPTSLRLGARGHLVRDLQRELRRRGLAVAIDGRFGPTTRAAVLRLQRRLNLPVSGRADPPLLRRLGIQALSAAAAPAPAPAGARYLRAFPVLSGYSYVDSWGAPRSQGGHEGTDILAPRGTPLLAVANATVERLSRIETGLGGIRVWLRDGSGHQYYYAHMESIETGLQVGAAVRTGQVLGRVGNSGDARGGPTHVHFEIHPSGASAINPFPELRAVDPAPTP